MVTVIVGHALEAGAEATPPVAQPHALQGKGQCPHCISQATVVLCTADDTPPTGAPDSGTRPEARSRPAARASPRLLWTAMGGASTAPQGLSPAWVVAWQPRSACTPVHLLMNVHARGTTANRPAHAERPIDRECCTLCATIGTLCKLSPWDHVGGLCLLKV